MQRCCACLSARWLGEPESPFVHQRMLDVEVLWIMEDGDLLWVIGTSFGLQVLVTFG